MSKTPNSKTDSGHPLVYQIRIEGHLGYQWMDWFDGLAITLEEHGDTLLTGPVIDQAALHGLLKKVRDSGMPLLSVNRVQSYETHQNHTNKERKMNAINKVTGIQDMKAVLSTLWIYLAVNYIYCDHLGLMEPEMFQGLATGHIGSIQVNQEFLLAAAVMMQIPFMMIVLSRVLKHGANRWANIIAGALMIAIQVGSMGMGTAPSLVYLFYSTIEIACNFVIIWMAWTWRNPEPRP